MSDIRLDGRSLTPRQLTAIAEGARPVLDATARARMAAGVRTGDWLAQKWSWLVGGEPPAEPAERVRRFILGHCAGVGPPLAQPMVRALIAARVNVLACGFSGVRPEIADALLQLLDGPLPWIPSQGSVGTAGSPTLAHVAQVLCGLGGRVWGDSGPVASEVRAVEVTEKEALALVNGDSLTAAWAGLVVARSRRLLEAAEAACALTFEVVRADLRCLDAEAMQERRHPGPIAVAERLRLRLSGSELCYEGRTPDPFSIRCAPAVLGAAWEVLEFVETVVERELNAAVDNPLMFGDRTVEAGNFHSAAAAMAMDQLKIALTQVASISERRTFRLTYGQLSGLPSFLVPSTGLNSGLMLAQYTTASLVSEMKGLSHPASVDSIPSVQHREDHASMGPIAGRTAWDCTETLADVLAIELMCASQGLEFHMDEGKQASRDSMLTHARVRSLVRRWTEDRVLHPALKALGTAVRGGVFS